MEDDFGLIFFYLFVKFGVSEIFNLIIDIVNVYCFSNFWDGFFDIKKYDVIEFDWLISYIDFDNGLIERDNVF